MSSDFFYESIRALGLPWIAVAIAYAVFDYIFNLIMCTIIGGFSHIKRDKIKKNKRNLTLRSKYTNFKNLLDKFFVGSRKQIKEFQNDKLSWAWPLTVLLLPTYFYGVSREVINEGVISLLELGISTQKYIISLSNNWIQIIFWAIAIFLGLRTFYRYHKERSKPTWFSRVWIYSLSRSILFGIPISYIAINIIFAWVQYSFFLFQILSDAQINYVTFHPDLMYGLKEVYNSVIIMGALLLILSLLPAIMLIREKQERYNSLYFLSVYSGLAILFIILGILVYKFDQQIADIQVKALSNIQNLLQSEGILGLETMANLLYFSIVSGLPNGFPVPTWFSFLLSARSALFLFEVIRIFSPSTKNLGLINFLQKIIGR